MWNVGCMRRVSELNFPGDDWHEEQETALERIKSLLEYSRSFPISLCTQSAMTSSKVISTIECTLRSANRGGLIGQGRRDVRVDAVMLCLL